MGKGGGAERTSFSVSVRASGSHGTEGHGDAISVRKASTHACKNTHIATHTHTTCAHQTDDEARGGEDTRARSALRRVLADALSVRHALRRTHVRTTLYAPGNAPLVSLSHCCPSARRQAQSLLNYGFSFLATHGMESIRRERNPPPCVARGQWWTAGEAFELQERAARELKSGRGRSGEQPPATTL